MECDVAEVVPEGLEGVDEVVEAEGEDGEGAVRLVRLLLAHRSAPEVVQEDCNWHSVTCDTVYRGRLKNVSWVR